MLYYKQAIPPKAYDETGNKKTGKTRTTTKNAANRLKKAAV